MLIVLFLTANKIAVMPVTGDKQFTPDSRWALAIAQGLNGTAADTPCSQFNCFKDVAKQMGASQYVVTTVIRYDKRLYVALRLHDVNSYAPVAKASRDWSETDSFAPELKAAAAALLDDITAPSRQVSARLRDIEKAPSPLPTVGWWLIGSGLAGIATSAILFTVSQLKIGPYRDSVIAYNDDPLRTPDQFSALQKQNREIQGYAISSYVIFGLSVPSLVSGIILLAKSK